jgi:hypothetical protein
MSPTREAKRTGELLPRRNLSDFYSDETRKSEDMDISDRSLQNDSIAEEDENPALNDMDKENESPEDETVISQDPFRLSTVLEESNIQTSPFVQQSPENRSPSPVEHEQSALQPQSPESRYLYIKYIQFVTKG